MLLMLLLINIIGFVRVEDEVDIFTSKILKAMELIEQKIRDQDVLGTQGIFFNVYIRK